MNRYRSVSCHLIIFRSPTLIMSSDQHFTRNMSRHMDDVVECLTDAPY